MAVSEKVKNWFDLTLTSNKGLHLSKDSKMPAWFTIKLIYIVINAEFVRYFANNRKWIFRNVCWFNKTQRIVCFRLCKHESVYLIWNRKIRIDSAEQKKNEAEISTRSSFKAFLRTVHARANIQCSNIQSSKFPLSANYSFSRLSAQRHRRNRILNGDVWLDIQSAERVVDAKPLHNV